MNIAKVDILNVNVSAVNLGLACELFEQWIRQKKKTYVCVVPVSSIMTAQSDEFFKNIINQADMATPDGMPTVWLGRKQGYRGIARTYGPDLVEGVCRRGIPLGYRHYFYGGTEQNLELLRNALMERFKGIEIVGMFAPPFRVKGMMEDAHILDQINRAKPDVLWIGIGSPKQEYWMAQHRNKLDVPVIAGIGAAFDFLSGIKPQAPRWMQRSGLEWLFRLASEPKRLWRRYLFGNTMFIYYLAKNSFQKKFSTSKDFEQCR